MACRAQVGLSAPQVQVEVSLASGLPGLCIVGLAATVVRESKERVRAALIHSGFEFPAGRITVSLSPADLPKEGGRFDLPIALGILLASGQLRAPASDAPGAWTRCEYYGELGLTGELNPVPGILPAAAQAQRQGVELIVPHANAAEACAAAPALARAAAHLLEVCAHLRGIAPLPLCAHARAGAHDLSAPPRANARLDLTDVRGQSLAKRALIIAAAGAHSLLKLCTTSPSRPRPSDRQRERERDYGTGPIGGQTRLSDLPASCCAKLLRSWISVGQLTMAPCRSGGSNGIRTSGGMTCCARSSAQPRICRPSGSPTSR